MRGCLVALLCWMACPVLAQNQEGTEDFPGQNDLAAGLACHQDLDLDCAQTRLEGALAQFQPERDPAYLQHVRTARMLLATIHVAGDNLQRAEREFKTLLLIDPGFDLPPGDHPPKVRYVLQQAREALQTTAVKKTQPEPQPKPKPPTKPKPVTTVQKKKTPESRHSVFGFEIGPRLVGLFGDDGQAASSGPGGSLLFAWRTPAKLGFYVQLAYAHHPAHREEAETVQAFSLATAGWYEVHLDPLAVRLGAGLGTLAMGTRDRYDHWGFLAHLVIDWIWPAEGAWALVLQLRPSGVITADGGSFFLPVGLSGALRW